MHVKNQTEQKGEIDHATFLQTFLLIFLPLKSSNGSFFNSE